MSSQVVVYGFIELATGSEERNNERLRTIRDQGRGLEFALAESISRPLRGWPLPIMSFARSFKKERKCRPEMIVASFEGVLKRLDAVSAQLSIDDEEVAGQKHLDYAYGPVTFGGSSVWVRVEAESPSGEPVEISL